MTMQSVFSNGVEKAVRIECSNCFEAVIDLINFPVQTFNKKGPHRNSMRAFLNN